LLIEVKTYDPKISYIHFY